jgi:hypothetical protein
MLSLKEQIQNLENILLNQQNLTPETRQILSKEIKRLEELANLDKDKPTTT